MATLVRGVATLMQEHDGCTSVGEGVYLAGRPGVSGFLEVCVSLSGDVSCVVV